MVERSVLIVILGFRGLSRGTVYAFLATMRIRCLTVWLHIAEDLKATPERQLNDSAASLLVVFLISD